MPNGNLFPVRRRGRQEDGHIVRFAIVRGFRAHVVRHVRPVSQPKEAYALDKKDFFVGAPRFPKNGQRKVAEHMVPVRPVVAAHFNARRKARQAEAQIRTVSISAFDTGRMHRDMGGTVAAFFGRHGALYIKKVCRQHTPATSAWPTTTQQGKTIGFGVG